MSSFDSLNILCHSSCVCECVSFVVINVLHDVLYRWFDSGRDDGQIERELFVVHYAQTPPPQEPIEEDEQGFFPLTVALWQFLLYVCMHNLRTTLGCI